MQSSSTEVEVDPRPLFKEFGEFEKPYRQADSYACMLFLLNKMAEHPGCDTVITRIIGSRIEKRKRCEVCNQVEAIEEDKWMLELRPDSASTNSLEKMIMGTSEIGIGNSKCRFCKSNTSDMICQETI